MNGSVQVVDSVPEAFALLVAGRLAGAGHEPASLFLSGGATARQCYAALARDSGPGGDRPIPWGSIDVYLGDERCVPPSDDDSNHKMIAHVLLEAVGPVFGDHPMYESGSPGDAAGAYQRLLSGLDGFDLVHLGLGPDGHTASLFPGSEALAITDPEQLVTANRDPNANNPHDRITLTLPAIARARLAVFTVAGTSKRDAFARVVDGEDLPAARVTADEVVWLVDAEAADGTGVAG